MYKILKNFTVISTMVLLTIFTLWDIVTFSAPIPGGITETVIVSNARTNITETISEIAQKHHVVIAKQIIEPSSTPQNGMMGAYKFIKLGEGKLPSIYPEELNKQIIKDSNDATNYIIIGNGLTAKALSQQLNNQGNVTFSQTSDTRLSPIQDLKDRYILPILIILITFVALLIAEYVSKLKEDGIRRLTGISRMRLAFSSVLRNGRTIFMITAVFLGLGGLYLALTHQFWWAYFESLALVLLLGALIFLGLDALLSVLIFYILQHQSINLSIKGKSPIMLIAGFIILFQAVAVITSMSSISTLNNANQQVQLLQAAQKSWSKEQQYYGVTALGSLLMQSQQNKQYQTVLKNFLIDFLNQPDSLLSYSIPLNNTDSERTWKIATNRYTYPSNGMPYVNLLYANPALIKKERITLPATIQEKIEHFSSGEYAILIPNRQKANFDNLVKTWSGVQSSLTPTLTENPISALYSSPQSLFGFSVMHNQFNNYSSFPPPIIIIFSSATFEKETVQQASISVSAYLGNANLLTSNRVATQQLFEKYQLQKYEGSFFNGYTAISNNLLVQENQRNLLLGVNLMCLISSLFLIFLLNSIYLYQNRREFLVQRLAGKSWLDIHMMYLAIVVILTAGISVMARLWLHVPNEAFAVPVIYLLLVFALFAVQVHRERQANVLYLKGL